MTARKGLIIVEFIMEQVNVLKTLNTDVSYQAVTEHIARSALNRVPNRWYYY